MYCLGEPVLGYQLFHVQNSMLRVPELKRYTSHSSKFSEFSLSIFLDYDQI